MVVLIPVEEQFAQLQAWRTDGLLAGLSVPEATSEVRPGEFEVLCMTLGGETGVQETLHFYRTAIMRAVPVGVSPTFNFGPKFLTLRTESAAGLQRVAVRLDGLGDAGSTGTIEDVIEVAWQGGQRTAATGVLALLAHCPELAATLPPLVLAGFKFRAPRGSSWGFVLTLRKGHGHSGLSLGSASVGTLMRGGPGRPTWLVPTCRNTSEPVSFNT
jgi:hypothetical protein